MSAKFTFDNLQARIDKNPIYAGIKLYRERIRSCLDDTTEPLLFVGGPPGIGKSFHFFDISRKMGKCYAQIAPGNDVHAFVNAIYWYGGAHSLLLDDHDKLLTAAKSKEIVKQAFGPQRWVFWQTKAAMAGNLPPPDFPVRTRLVWLSNHNASIVDDADLQAIFDRGANPVFIEGTDADLFRYVVYMVISDQFFQRKDGISARVKAEALNWFVANRNHLQRISLRTMQSATRYIKGCGPNEARKRTLLSGLLTPKATRDVSGFRSLKMVEPGVWKEV